MQDVFDFSGRTVFVAGGSRGINLGIALTFAAQGARVGILSRSQAGVDAAVAALREHHPEAAGWSADVRDPTAVATALEAAHARFGPTDVLVSGAAGNVVAPALELSADLFKAVVDIDLLGTFNVLRTAHAFLRKPGASVINISAPQAFNPTPLQAHVCAAKAGVDMLTRVLAQEWGPQGIRVNSIVPGPIAGTEGLRGLAPTPEDEQRLAAAVPLGRFGQVSEVADMVLVLSSRLAHYVTGVVLPVDGGSSLMGGRDFSAALAVQAGRLK
jgi:NAD(P)-dependent dehydrogenase (short-subunit alcohol dehydrogenase family)